MLTARYLAGCSDEVVKLYSQLESDILIDMVKRLKRLGRITDSTLYQMEVYKEIGGLQNKVLEVIKSYDVQSQKMIVALFNEAIEKATMTDLKLSMGREMSEGQIQTLEATLKKLQSAPIINSNQKTRKDFAEEKAIKVFSGLQRLTMTIADTSSSQFVNVANKVYMQVSTGAFDYDKAFKMGVDELARQGLYTVNYTDSIDFDDPEVIGGLKPQAVVRSIESAVRTNILSGINQTVSQITQDNCEELGTDLVEVSAHLGARDGKYGKNPWSDHSALQGKVYCLNGERYYTDGNGERKYAPNFKETCGIGFPDGICGINCRHSYYPYFEGQSQHYSEDSLEKMNEKKVPYNGQKITQYEAEQQLRLFERAIRKWKRQADMEQSVGEDNTIARTKIFEWQKKARELCEQTGLKRDYAREYIGTKSGKQPKGLDFESILPY